MIETIERKNNYQLHVYERVKLITRNEVAALASGFALARECFFFT